MSDSVITDDILAGLRAEAQQSGGSSFVRCDEKGQWFSGVVKDTFVDEAPFGPVQTLTMTNVRSNTGEWDSKAEVTFRLSRSVLQKELGPEAEDGGAKAGMLVYVACNGQRQSKAGKAYFSYSVTKVNAKEAAALAKKHKGAEPPPSEAPDAAELVKQHFGGEEEPPF